MFTIHTDYYDQEFFDTRAKAKQFCLATYGPDETDWPEIIKIELWKPVEVPNGRYVAVAWWPREEYEKEPSAPCVRVEWVTGDEIPEPWHGEPTFVIEDKKSARTAEKKALAAANQRKPTYRRAYSSNTSSGYLPVYCRTDMPIKKWP